MSPGEIVKSSRIVQNYGAKTPTDFRETWMARKGNQFVFLCLGIESFDQPLDVEKTLEAMGWTRKKK